MGHISVLTLDLKEMKGNILISNIKIIPQSGCCISEGDIQTNEAGMIELVVLVI